MIDTTKAYRTKDGLIAIDIKVMECTTNTVYGICDIDGRYRIVQWDATTGECLTRGNEFDLVVGQEG